MISHGSALLKPPKGHFHFDLARHLVRPSRAFNFYDTFLMYSQCAIFIVIATVPVVVAVVVIVAFCCCHHLCSRLVCVVCERDRASRLRYATIFIIETHT